MPTSAEVVGGVVAMLKSWASSNILYFLYAWEFFAELLQEKIRRSFQ
jgi:hypothetical protein